MAESVDNCGFRRMAFKTILKYQPVSVLDMPELLWPADFELQTLIGHPIALINGVNVLNKKSNMGCSGFAFVWLRRNLKEWQFGASYCNEFEKKSKKGQDWNSQGTIAL